MIVVFTGGTGGTKLVQGLHAVMPAEDLTVIVNTGDDLQWWGLHVSPDIDSVLYGLSGQLSKDRGWGMEDESFRCLERMRSLQQPGWFSLGDLDLATHLTRTSLLRSGMSLSQATRELAFRMGIGAQVLPMSDDPVATVLDTAKGRLSFQEYFVRERHSVEVHAVEFVGAEKAMPAPGVLSVIASAEAIVFAPSNPITSIGPVLAVPGVREALARATAPVIAVSPFIGKTAVSGPAAELMRVAGTSGSVAGLAQIYSDFISAIIADDSDRDQGVHSLVKPLMLLHTNILMKTIEDKRGLAEFVLQAARQFATGATP